VLEEPEHAARQPLAPAQDDRLGAQVSLNLGDELVDGAPAIDARARVAAVTQAGARLAPERFEQLPRSAHA
jgi:hypothetical protein